jgi:rhamnosyltransferase
MIERPTVLVLLATFNGEHCVEEQIHSILCQREVDVQIRVSDDCSEDGTIAIVEQLAGHFGSISIVSRGLKFGSAALNFFHLIRCCSVDGFDYVAFSDQDDIWFEDKLIKAITSMVEHGANGFSSDAIAFWPETNRTKIIKKSDAVTGIDHWFESPGPGCSQVFSAQSFRHFQSFTILHFDELREIDYHDWLIYAFYKFHQLGWIISDNPRFLYIQHSNNQIGANSGWHAIYRRFLLIKSRWYRDQINRIYSVISGVDTELVSFKFIICNGFRLRRKFTDSLIIVFLFLVRVF